MQEKCYKFALYLILADNMTTVGAKGYSSNYTKKEYEFEFVY
jgi:hypothetical protein